MTDDEYCGFSCEALLRKQKRIVDNILDFNKYNPEFSMVMIGECMKMLYEAKNEMIEMRLQTKEQIVV